MNWLASRVTRHPGRVLIQCGRSYRPHSARPEECFFWATHTGAELDLLIVSGRRRLGFEVKRTTAPRLTRSMAVVLEDLELERLDILHAGEATFPLGEKVRAVAAGALLEEIEPLREP